MVDALLQDRDANTISSSGCFNRDAEEQQLGVHHTPTLGARGLSCAVPVSVNVSIVTCATTKPLKHVASNLSDLITH